MSDSNVRNEQLVSKRLVILEQFTHEQRHRVQFDDEEPPGEYWTKGGAMRTREPMEQEVREWLVEHAAARLAPLTVERLTGWLQEAALRPGSWADAAAWLLPRLGP